MVGVGAFTKSPEDSTVNEPSASSSPKFAVITEVPSLNKVTIPCPSTEATPSFEEENVKYEGATSTL